MIFRFFELRCNRCDERYDQDFFDLALWTVAQVRAEAKKKGWTRIKPSKFNDTPADLCEACSKGEG